MFFQRLKTPGLGHNSYLLDCGEGLAVVVDPRRDVEEYVRLARENGLTIGYILETHRQEDFEFGSRNLAKLTGAKVVGGRHRYFGRIDLKLADKAALEVGTARFVLLETPGHTPESVTYAAYLKDAGKRCWGVFTGDALFVGDTGRTDLPDPAKTGENAGLLYDSVHRRIAPLGEQALLYPAHGSGSACGGHISKRDDSTLGIEMKTNSVFTMTRREFIAHKVAEKLARPPYFEHMEKVNLLAGRPLKPQGGVDSLQPAEFARRMKGRVVIDTRPAEAFAASHVPGSYNIWLEGLPAFAGWVASESSRVLLVVASPEATAKAVASLARIGIDRVEGVLAGGVGAWRQQGHPIASLGATSAQEVAERMQREPLHILDVRDDYEWDEKHIPGALHAYAGSLEDNLPDLPKDADIVVHCSLGSRSGVAASILKRNGFTRVSNLFGGLMAWEKLGLPLEKPKKSKKPKEQR